ncbi:MAG: hypothetical protein KDC54_17655 [Lewinella sp.]|nr:hypothetical protein [Lewinella sp.]
MKVNRLVVLLLLLAACRSSPDPVSVIVECRGAMRNFMVDHDISAKASLDTFANRRHLYALGAMEDLKGEIQVFDGEPYLSRVFNGSLAFNGNFAGKAALLVYAEVPAWESFPVPGEVVSQAGLEAFIATTGRQHGLDPAAAFPFLLEGQAASVDWHVIDWPAGDTEHTHEKHRTSGLYGTLTDEPVEVLGFLSTSHTGIFVHHTTDVHMHLKTTDGRIAGHVDALSPGAGMVLKLPK